MWWLVPLAIAEEPPAAPELDRAALAEYWARRLRSTAPVVGEDWNVLRDGLVLDARTFAAEVGDLDTVARLDRRRSRWRAVGAIALGLGAAWTGYLLVPAAASGEPGAVAEAAFGGMLTGGPVMLAGAGALVVAERQRHAPARAIYAPEEADHLVREHNRALADALALDPALVAE